MHVANSSWRYVALLKHTNTQLTLQLNQQRKEKSRRAWHWIVLARHFFIPSCIEDDWQVTNSYTWYYYHHYSYYIIICIILHTYRYTKMAVIWVYPELYIDDCIILISSQITWLTQKAEFRMVLRHKCVKCVNVNQNYI